MELRGHRLSEIAHALGASFNGANGDPFIRHISIDSRKPYPPETTLFIALKGERHDGARYIPQLVERGFSYFLVNATAAQKIQGTVLIVTDTLIALQQLAAWHRAQFSYPVIGITGSNGKTVVKEWLFQLLQDSEHIVRSPGSWNSQVGVPLSVWEMGSEHSLALFEAGISTTGEMARLRAIIAPSIGIFTTIGPAHSENFNDDNEKVNEKLLLFEGAKTVVFCADQDVVGTAVNDHLKNTKALSWSRKKDAWLTVINEEKFSDRSRISVVHDGSEFAFELPFSDPASIENALHCVTLLLYLGKSHQFVQERMPHLTPVAMRLEVVDGMHGTTLINDAYSNDEASLGIALDHLVVVAQGRPRTVVLSDIPGNKNDAKALYDRVFKHIERAGVCSVIGIGKEMMVHRDLFPASSQFYADVDAALKGIDPDLFNGHTVLIKGARAFELEKLVARWQRQVHGTVLEIDLEAIRHNLNHYRALLTRPTRTMAMVKAFGYGSGALELARLFAHEQVQYLGVAYADEGIDLRQNGIRLPILVMNPEPVPLEALHRFRLEAEVFDTRSLNEAIRMAELHDDAPPIHLKLDTGMHRLGFATEEIPALIDRLRSCKQLNVAGIFSHLAASDDTAFDAFTREQISLFTAQADAITAVLSNIPLRHIANSSAITRFPEAHMDMVRLGIGLHGIGSTELETRSLRSTATLRSPIAQIKTLQPGATVGYGRSWKATRQTRIATLPIGYADGLSRKLSNGVGRLHINGAQAPIVGTVCMDMCMVDVTDIACSLDDMATVFDAEHPVTELAQTLGTIPYEVLTGIAQRVKRVYVQG